MKKIIEQAKKLYSLEDYNYTPASGHEGGRNQIVIVSRDGEKLYVLRISSLVTEAKVITLLKQSLCASLRKWGACGRCDSECQR